MRRSAVSRYGCVAPLSSFWMPCSLSPARSARPSCVSPAASRYCRSKAPKRAGPGTEVSSSRAPMTGPQSNTHPPEPRLRAPARLAPWIQVGGQVGGSWLQVYARRAQTEPITRTDPRTKGEHPEMQKMHDRTEAEYAEPAADDVRKLQQMYAGHHISQALYVMAELGIADL